jgi:hypothetical protein
MAGRRHGLRRSRGGYDTFGRTRRQFGRRAGLGVADIISLTVLNDEQVREVVGELAAHAKAGRVIAIHSTISPLRPSSLADEIGDCARYAHLDVTDPDQGGRASTA